MPRPEHITISMGMMKKSLLQVIALLAAGCWSIPAFAIQVEVNTAPLHGSGGYIAIDFIAGSPAPGNSATVNHFQTDGTLGAFSSSGAVTGSLIPGPLVLHDGQFFNEWLQSVTAFGDYLSFSLDLGQNTVSGGIPDSFSFFLLDANQMPIVTSDPAGALISIDLNGAATVPVVYTSDSATVTLTDSGPGSVVALPIPTLSELALMTIGLIASPTGSVALDNGVDNSDNRSRMGSGLAL